MRKRFLKEIDKQVLRSYFHQLDNEKHFWAYIEQIASDAYNKGLNNKKGVK